jgi:Tfp pilus assembly protein PilF
MKFSFFWKKLWVGLAVAAIFLLLLEGLARLLLVDRWEQSRPNLSSPLFVPGEGAQAGRYVTNPHFLGAMSQQSFAMVKSPGVTRVFVLGGSAALGWPGPEGFSFAGYLRRALEKSAPGRYEIINAAAMSYGSHRVRDLLHDVVKLDPDVVVLWSGNNEYIERNQLSTYARTPVMSGLQRALHHSDLYRGLRVALQAAAPELFVRQAAGDITDLRSTPKVRRGMLGRSAESDRQILDNYRTNVQAMAELIAAEGATGIFCTVPVNLSGWAPANTPPVFADQRQFERWQNLQQQVFALWDQRQFADAMPRLRQLLEIAPDYALAHYLSGLGHQQAGQLQEARKAFERARDLDPRPLRALSTFAPVVRSIGASRGTRLVDLEEAFVVKSGANLSGAELFIDYVHPNERGAKLAATRVLEALLLTTGATESGDAVSRLIDQDDWFSRNFDWEADYYYALGMTYQNNGDFGRAEQAYLKVLEKDPRMPEAAGNLGFIHERLGNLATARSYYQQAVLIDPGTVVAADLARVLYLQGERSSAREMGQRLLAQGVVNVDLLILLGDIEMELGQPATAGNYYRQALAAGGDEGRLRMRLAAAGQ